MTTEKNLVRSVTVDIAAPAELVWSILRACGCSRCRTGPSWTSGNASISSRSPSCRCTSPRSARCYPLTGAIDSDADDLPAIISEMLVSRTSERQGRLIDSDSAGSMEKKKQEGYF